MDVILYRCNAERNRLDKSDFMHDAITAAAHIKGNFQADAPEIYLDYHGELEGYNYMSCTIGGYTFYYFCTITADLGQTVRASCKRDVLMTFRPQLLGMQILVDRCTKQAQANDPAGYNSLIPDSRIRITAQSYYREFALTGINFSYPTGYGTSVPQYVLGVIG